MYYEYTKVKVSLWGKVIVYGFTTLDPALKINAAFYSSLDSNWSKLHLRLKNDMFSIINQIKEQKW